MTALLAAYDETGCTGRCGPDCWTARLEPCRCICVGRLHGVGREKALLLLAGLELGPEMVAQPELPLAVHTSSAPPLAVVEAPEPARTPEKRRRKAPKGCLVCGSPEVALDIDVGRFCGEHMQVGWRLAGADPEAATA